MSETKRCNCCGSVKALDEFYRGRRKGKWSYTTWCKECTRKYMRERYKHVIPKVGETRHMRGNEYIKKDTGGYGINWTDDMLRSLVLMRMRGMTYKRIGAMLGLCGDTCRIKYNQIKA